MKPTIHWFYDTEFVDDGTTVELISIGVVPGPAMGIEPYYAVNADCDWVKVTAHPWLRDNVWPKLPLKQHNAFGSMLETIDHDHPDVKPKAQIRFELRELFRTYTLNSDHQALWAYFAAYDHLVLSQLWGKMLDLPPHVPMWSHDLMQEWERHGYWHPLRPPKPVAIHNALEDAKWNREFYDRMQRCNGECGSCLGRVP